MALRGLGSPRKVDRAMRLRAAMLLQRGPQVPMTSHPESGTTGAWDSRAQLEANKVSDVVVDDLSFLNGRPGGIVQSLRKCHSWY